MPIDVHDPKLFLSTVEPWTSCYTRVRVSYAARNTEQGLLLLWYGATLCGPASPNKLKPFRHESDSIICGTYEEDYTASWIGDQIKAFESGTVTVDGLSMTFVLNTGQKPNYFVRRSVTHDFEQSDRGASIQISGGQFGNERHEVDHDLLQWEIRGAKPPYDDLNELLRLAGVRRDVYSSQISSPSADIDALAPAFISLESSIKNGKATIVVDASTKASKSDIAISYKTVSSDAISRRYDIGGIEWKADNGLLQGKLSLDTGEAAEIHVFLKYKGEAIGHRWFRDPHKYINPQLAIYETFDVDSTNLRKMLFDAKREAVSFEVGVGILLSTLGFETSHHGAVEKLQDGPDIIARVPGVDVVIVIECTTDVLDKNDKLSKLVRRSKALEDSLEGAKFGRMRVIPVIVSALPEKQLNTHVDVAANNKVAIVNKEVLEAWMEKRRDPQHPIALLAHIRGLVPRTANGQFEDLLGEPQF